MVNLSNSPPPRVSVVLTAYNAEAFIDETLDSILGQTFEDFELIVIDDGSTDATCARVEAYDDPRIRLVRNEVNIGISNARNKGIDLARGDIICAHDHDDLSMPERLARQVAYLDENPNTVLVAASSRSLKADGKARDQQRYSGIEDPTVLRWTLMLRSPIIHSSICVRASAFKDNGIHYQQRYHYAEDFELYHRLAKVGDLICLPERLVVYRLHEVNTQIVKRREMLDNCRDFLVKVYEDWLGRPVKAATVETMFSIVNFGRPARDREELLGVGALLRDLLAAFLAQVTSDKSAGKVRQLACEFWWRAVSNTAKEHGRALTECFDAYPELSMTRPTATEIGKTWGMAMLGPGISDAIRRPFRRLRR